MAEQPTQTYATHRHRPTLWYVAFLCAALALVVTIFLLAIQPAVFTAGLLLMSIALFCAVLMVRQYALKVQDRIIRLEMQVRAARLGLDGRFGQLSIRQIIALRFASDAELPALMDRTITEKLDADQIKRAVTNWQGDYSRV